MKTAGKQGCSAAYERGVNCISSRTKLHRIAYIPPTFVYR